jgi:hypothetical protein
VHCLFSLGRREIAYVNFYPRHFWPKTRSDGLHSVFSQAGYSSGVHDIAASPIPYFRYFESRMNALPATPEVGIHSQWARDLINQLPSGHYLVLIKI